MVSDGETGGRRNWNLLLEAPRKYYRRHDAVKAPETFFVIEIETKRHRGQKMCLRYRKRKKEAERKIKQRES